MSNEYGLEQMNRADFRSCKAILFDFGGTLDTDGEHWLDRFYALYEEAAIDFPREQIKRVFYEADAMCCCDPQVNHLGLRPLMRRHIDFQFTVHQFTDELQKEQMIDAFCTKTEHYLERNARLLNRLRDRYKMGVVSNFYGNVAAICEEAGLAQSFVTILDSMRLGFGKPEPEIFRVALQQMDVAAEECLFVGDSYERDMMPAGKLGMKTVWLKGPNPRIPANAEPVDGVISSLLELEPLLV
jgi:putative hydrolase of the HAD superfamily